MRKALFLCLVLLGFAAAVPRAHAAPVCSSITKTTHAGKFDGQLCMDAVTQSIALNGTLTLADGSVYKLELDGSINMTLVKFKPVYVAEADIVIKDAAGATVWDSHITFTSSSLMQVLSKLSSTVANLPAALNP